MPMAMLFLVHLRHPPPQPHDGFAPNPAIHAVGTSAARTVPALAALASSLEWKVLAFRRASSTTVL